MVDKDEVERIARHAWGAAQRLGMQIAALPLEKRPEAFAKCEEALRESAEKYGNCGCADGKLYEASNGGHPRHGAEY